MATDQKVDYYSFFSGRNKCAVTFDNRCPEKATGQPWAIFKSGSAAPPTDDDDKDDKDDTPPAPTCFKSGMTISGCSAGKRVNNIASPEDCQAICKERKECEAFTFVPPRGQNGGKCFPKGDCKAKKGGKNKISGPKKCH